MLLMFLQQPKKVLYILNERKMLNQKKNGTNRLYLLL